ncbi:MAG: hypothetical protein E7571_06105 [Ruminococcaceae bacterium]|nr:hypothetical protein [Oscillospiraceae bacterium]
MLKPETKTELKKIAIGSAKILSFIIIGILLIEILSFTYFSKRGATTYKTSLNKAYSFLHEPANTLDIVGIGNSDLYSAMVPAELWSKYGYTCNVISSPHQTPLQSYKMLQSLFENQKPKVVVVEIDMLYDDSLEDRSAVIGEENFIQFLFSNFNADDFDELIKTEASIFTFHDKWKHIGEPQKIETPHSHGYKYSDTVRRVVIKDYMTETDKKEPIKNANAQQLANMVKLCHDNGCEVFFVEMPTVTSWNSERHNAVADLSEKMNIDFVDYNLLVDEIGLNLNRSFRDMGNHLNYDAAVKLTDNMGEYIKNNYNLEDRRKDPNYKFYQESVDKFYEEIKTGDFE